MILTPLQKLPKNVGNSGKIIVAIGFEWLPKVQKIAKSGHTVCRLRLVFFENTLFAYHQPAVFNLSWDFYHSLSMCILTISMVKTRSNLK